VLLGGFASMTADARSRIQFSLWRRLFDADRDVLARLGVLTGVRPAFLAGMTPAELEEAIVESARNMPPGSGRQADLALRVDIAARLASISAPTRRLAHLAGRLLSRDRGSESGAGHVCRLS
jgi:3-oxoadipate enol-lactonase